MFASTINYKKKKKKSLLFKDYVVIEGIISLLFFVYC